MNTGCIYFIGDEHDRVKIGWARSPENRRRELQCGNADRLTLLIVVPGCRQEHERMLHDWFAPQRLIGEWFHCGRSERCEIAAIIRSFNGAMDDSAAEDIRLCYFGICEVGE